MFRALSILMAGYGAAAAAAIAVFVAGAGFLAAILVFWLGGAVVVCGIAVVKAAQWSRMPEHDSAETDRVLAEALRAWEADRLDDRPLPLGKTGSE
jgi:NADH:ubiquinone oxidoreductase subunit 6 (subunit J)